MWLLAVAMPAEARLLLDHFSPAGEVGGRPIYEGRLGPALGRRPACLVLTGMGQVNAAQAVTAVLERLPGVGAVVNLGCAGSLPASGLAPGDAALASEAVFADLGIRTGRGWHGIRRVGIPLGQGPAGEPLYNRLPVDPTLLDLLAAAFPDTPVGPFACVNQISGDPATAGELARRWDAVVEEMEGAAVALVARHYAKPFAALRGVSNLAGHRHLDVPLGAEAPQRLLLS
ncbi:MAG: futalosine hydrolase [Deltaproteobacteria bacterium]|nr:futalosine hydrolase [Deltaproteobacteria bacterium]